MQRPSVHYKMTNRIIKLFTTFQFFSHQTAERNLKGALDTGEV